jgi:hypothetical protein
MPASDRFVFDGFGAEGTFHQLRLRFLARIRESISSLILKSSSRAPSIFRTRSSRSAVSDAGTPTSREQELQTRTEGSISDAQYGQFIFIQFEC